METNETQKPSAVWAFLNSNFGLFLCSSVFITFISWSFTQVQQINKGEADRKQTIQKLVTEIKYRNILLASRLNDYYYYEDDSMNYYVVDATRIVFKGLTEETVDGKTTQTDFTPIFPEYSHRGMINLYWELISYSDNEKSSTSDAYTKGLIKFNIDMQNLLKNDEDAGASTYMTTEDIESLDSILVVFANHIDSTYF